MSRFKVAIYAIGLLILVTVIYLVLVCTSLLFLLSETMKLLGPEWGLALVNGALTAVLVTITALQMREAHRTRLEANRPSFSLQPSHYNLGGGFVFLDLVNGGGVARNIDIDVVHGTVQTFLFNSSIGTGERANVLRGNFPSVSGLVKIHIRYYDSYGHKQEEDLSLDFDLLKKENRTVTYLRSPIDVVCDRLRDIEGKLRDIERNLQ